MCCRTSADEVYNRLKKVNTKPSPRSQRIDAEKELGLMLKRQHEYDIIANQINVNLNNQHNQQHTNKLLAENKLPSSSVLSEAEDQLEGAKDSEVRVSSAVGEPAAAAPTAPTAPAGKPKKGKSIAAGKPKKKKRSANDEDYDSDDFDEVIAQSMKVLDVRPPKSVKPSNQNNPRLSNLRYKH